MSNFGDSTSDKTLSDFSGRDLKKIKREEKKKIKSEKLEKKNESWNEKAKTKPKVKAAEKLYYSFQTKPGEKKNTKLDMPDKYHPSYVESAWYEWWQSKRFFSYKYKVSPSDAEKLVEDNKFVMIMPPPNVTGTLHLGHALMCALEDALSRWNRMRGKVVLWSPGCDHAGIATQVVVEKKLKEEKKLLRHDLGREKFIEEVWKWRNDKGDMIYEQMKRLGISVDWSTTFFTMDEIRSKAVTEAFIRLHKKRLIYRAKRMVNWSCALKSAISDIEVDNMNITGRTFLSVPGYDDKIEFGVLIEFAYEIEDSDEKIIVATTRIETMLGDVAVAVNPEDCRYKNLIGKFIKHPFCNRKFSIIADQSVDICFGTGAVKITPYHDPIDYEIGNRHALQGINIFDDEGRIVEELELCENYKHFIGMKRFDARKSVIDCLKKLELFVRKIDHSYVIPICSRSKDIIEPVLKSQWYVKCKDMANKACMAVKCGELKIYPNSHEKTWFYWMENIQDWCISRQLWWGHRVPAYFVTSSQFNSNRDDENYWVSAASLDEAIDIAEEKFNISRTDLILTHDEDVLDTWFSSGLLPLSVFGWPDNESEFDIFYPTTLLETGYDILFFWVARMVMLSVELTGLIPFKHILLHSIIRDSHGRKMSKSLGNIIDPVHVIEGISLELLQKQLSSYNIDFNELEKAKKGQIKDYPNGIPECGSDALRFTLCCYSGSKKDINLDVLRVQGYRFFCNKIWNAARFCFNYFDSHQFIDYKLNFNNISLMDKWILSRLSYAEEICNTSFEKYDLSTATTAIYNFWLYDFCDIYIESVKPILNGGNYDIIKISLKIMFICVDFGLRLLHPFMPFITEELYQRLPFNSSHFENTPSICVSDYPFQLDWRNETLDVNINLIMSTVNVIRSSKDDYVSTKTKVNVYIYCYSIPILNLYNEYYDIIKILSNASNITLTTHADTIPNGCIISTNGNSCDVYIVLKGLIDISKEITKTEIKLGKVEQNISNINKLMDNLEYSTKVPQSIQQSNTDKIHSYLDEYKKLKLILENLKIAQ
ncbi:hypothetical protein HZS_650 [Henneguya salminicola]|nr:hypothetical protein HZS_650 [Henneguya salminicola]